jgi:PadR family transcriptional regulator PadR
MRLKQNGLLNYIWVESTLGPPRKYYSLTAQGREFLQELENAYTEIENAVNYVKNNPMKESSLNNEKIIAK